MGVQQLQAFRPENWTHDVLQCDQPVLVDFRAPWSDPVLFHNGELEDFQIEWHDFVRVGFADAFRFQDLIFRHPVGEFPTLALFQSGHWVKAFGGPGRVKALREWLLTPEAMDEEDPITHILKDIWE